MDSVRFAFVPFIVPRWSNIFSICDSPAHKGEGEGTVNTSELWYYIRFPCWFSPLWGEGQKGAMKTKAGIATLFVTPEQASSFPLAR